MEAPRGHEAALGFCEVPSGGNEVALPVAVFMQPDAEKLSVGSVYIDDGVLCIDVEARD